MPMVEIQKELFDEFGGEKRKKKRGLFRRSETEPISFSSSFDTLLLGILILVMGVVIIYAVGVEVGHQEKSRLARRESMKTVIQPVAVRPIQPQQAQMPAGSPKKTSPPEREPVRKYTVQIASFTKSDAAEQALGKLRKEKAGVEIFLMPGSKQIALCIGNYETRAAADRALSELQKKYKDSFVRNR